MPTSPIHTFISTSPSTSVRILAAHSTVSTSSDFDSSENIRKRFDIEPEINIKSLDKLPFADSSILSDQIQRPLFFPKGSFGKRRFTFSGSFDQKTVCKKRRRVTSVALPTKFLLGGNITDPLNLKSLDNDSRTKKLNVFSPASSPLSSATPRNQVQVLVPSNINDPLNLNTEEDIDVNFLSSKPRRRRRHRKTRKEGDLVADSDKTLSSTLLVPLCELPILPNSSSILTLSFVSNFDDKSGNVKETVSSPEESISNISSVIVKQETKINNTEHELLNNSSNSDTQMSSPDGPMPPNKISISVTIPSSQVDDATSVSINLLHKAKPNAQDTCAKSHSSNNSFSKIVSPAVPQGSPVKLLRQISSHTTSKDNGDKSFGQRLVHRRKHFREPHRQQFQSVKVRANAEKFCYGNHVTNLSNWNDGSSYLQDQRLEFFNKDWFQNKDVLDIGCNTGQLTLFIARYFEPRKIVGIDIDRKLINTAQRQMRQEACRTLPQNAYFPNSIAYSYGPLAKLAIDTRKSSNEYPNNVSFFEANFVPAAEDDLETQKGEYDAILCLRVTKWIHLNFGDHGIKLAFKRMHALLRFGGYLIFEPQPWFTYSASKKITPAMYKTYCSIEMRPESFCNYLLSKEIGFSSCQLIGSTFNYAKDYRQPLYLLSKGFDKSNESAVSVFSSPFHNDEWTCDDC